MKGVINIFGDIGDDVTLIDVVQQVEKQKDATSFTVNLNSNGGYVSEGFAIYDYLSSLEQSITMNGQGVVASIASIIFLAGDKRRVQRGTVFMIHLPAVKLDDYNTSDDFDEASKQLKKIERDVMKFYEKHTSLRGATLRELLKQETYLNAEQLYDFGFTTAKQELRAVAKLNINQNRDEMTEQEKLEAKKAKGILEKIKAFFADEGAVMKTLKTANEKELEFSQVDDEAKVKVGDTATVDGSPADGEYVLADGRKLVFELGKLVEIIEAGSEDDGNQDEEIQALKEENEKLKKQVENKTDEAADAVAKLTEAKNTLKDIEKIQSKVVAKKQTKEKKKGVLDGAFDNLRK